MASPTSRLLALGLVTVLLLLVPLLAVAVTAEGGVGLSPGQRVGIIAPVVTSVAAAVAPPPGPT